MPNSKQRKLADHFTVPEFAKQKAVSAQAIYKAIKNKQIIPVYVGTTEIALIPPVYLQMEFKKPAIDPNPANG